jgi:hypothetical protein
VRISFGKGSLTSNHHGTQRKGEPWNREPIRGWTCRIVTLETFRRLSTGTEAIQSLAGRRLWIYAPSGKCWHFDIFVVPTMKDCEP